MSRPDWLQGTYARSKADTKICTTWLVETAKETGFAAKLIDNRSEVEKETKLTVQNYETQATHVVEQLKRRPKIRVPQYVLSMLRSAINARSRVAK
jgi:hypothetical protein